MNDSKLKKNLLQFLIINSGVSIYVFLFTISAKSFSSFVINFLICGLYTFFLGFGNFFLNDALNRRFSWEKQLKKRLFYGILGTLFVNVLLVYACNYVNFVCFNGLKPQVFFTQKFNFINWFIINMSIMISAILHARGFLLALKQKNTREVDLQNQIANQASAQFASLKNQLDPHFLFNSLNVLSALIDENPKLAQKFTIDMSKIYRYVLEQKDKQVVTIKEEIDFANVYCELLKIRFEDSLDFRINIDSKHYNDYVIPLSLQLLLENTIKHNFASPNQILVIEIYIAENYLIVENNLQKRAVLHSSTGIGLENIIARYQLMTDIEVKIERLQDKFVVKLPIIANNN